MLEVRQHGRIAEVRLDRAPANALDGELLERLRATLDTLRREQAPAIILTGRPGMFSGGLDVPALLALDRHQMQAIWALFFAVIRQLAGSPVPVIAALSGHAPAGGAVLALQCDYRIGVRGRFRIGLNEVQVGLPVPPTILLALDLVVGPRLARRLSTRGEMLSMEDALSVGLIDELVDPDELLPAALARAGELLALPPTAMNVTRLAGKARLIEALATADDPAVATDWWFSPETQAGMRALVARLQKN